MGKPRKKKDIKSFRIRELKTRFSNDFAKTCIFMLQNYYELMSWIFEVAIAYFILFQACLSNDSRIVDFKLFYELQNI